MPLPSAEQIVAATLLVVSERDQLRALLARVDEAVLDKAPDGLSVAYLPAELLADIRARLA